MVVDESALITLHRLGLLERAVDAFGKLHVSSSLLLGHLDGTHALLPRQSSSKTNPVQVSQAFERGLLELASDPATCPVVDEYPRDIEATSRFAFRDLASALHGAGRISDAEHQDLLKVSHRTALAPHALAPLCVDMPVRIPLRSLYTLAGTGLLHSVLAAFRVVVQEHELREATMDSEAYSIREQVRDWHANLWEFVVKDSRIVAIEPPLPATDDSSNEAPWEPTLDALQTARSMGYCLLSDDRCLRRVIAADHHAGARGAMTTDELLAAMKDAGSLTEDEHADAFLQLIEWRYRFLVPSSSILMTLARRYRHAPPGKDLRAIARYGHDCLCDPGLPKYGSSADIMPTYADRLTLQWSNLVADFVASVATDRELPDPACERLVSWAAHELLPSAPRILQDRAARLDRLLPRHALTAALSNAAASPHIERAHHVIAAFGSALGLDEAEYLRIVAEVVRGI